MAVKQVSYNGSLKGTQELLSKMGITNLTMLKEILNRNVAELSPAEQTLVKRLNELGIKDVAAFDQAKEQYALAAEEKNSIIASKEETIAKLEADVKYLEEHSAKLDQKQKETIAKLKEQVYSLRGQRGYLANKVKELSYEVEVLKTTIALQDGLNSQLNEELRAEQERSAENLHVANSSQAALAAMENKVKGKLITKIATGAVALTLAAATIVASIGWANEAKRANSLESERDSAYNTIIDLEDERDFVVSQLNQREKQIYNILDRTITNMQLYESDIFADQDLANGQIPNKVTVFGDEYNINVSDLGKAYLTDKSDDQITMDYFADITDGLEFVNGCANEYLPSLIESLESEIASLNVTIDDLKHNNGSETIAQLEGRISELEAELEQVKLNAKETEETLRAEISDLVVENGELKGQLDTAESERDAAEAERDALQESLDDLQDRYDILNGKYEKAIESGKVSETTINALATKLAQVEEELNTTKGELSNAQALLAEKDAAYAELLDSYTKSQQEITDKEAKIAELEIKVGDLEDKVVELENKLANSNAKEESPSNSNTNEETTNTPVADENEEDGLHPDENPTHDKDDQTMENGRGR